MSYELVFDAQTDGFKVFWLVLLPLIELSFAFVWTYGLMLERQTRKKLSVLKTVILVAGLKGLLTVAMAAIVLDYVRLTWLFRVRV